MGGELESTGSDGGSSIIGLIGFQWGVTVARRSQLGFPA